MKNKNVLRSIPVLALLINALVIVMPDFDVAQMIVAWAVIGGMSCFVYIKQAEEFPRKIYWYALAALLIGVMVRGMPFDFSNFGEALGSFFSLGASGAEILLLIGGFAFMIISHWAMKGVRHTWGMVVARYGVLYLIMYIFGSHMVYHQVLFVPVLLAVIGLAAASELYSQLLDAPKPATLRAFVFLMVYLFLTRLFEDTAYRIFSILNEQWLYALVLLPLAGLILAENYLLYDKGTDKTAARNSIAWAMIAWVVFRLIAVIFPIMWNPVVLYLLFPLGFVMCVLCATKLPGLTWNKRFFISGGTMLIALLALARTQLQTVSAYVLLLLIFGALVCVLIIAKKPMASATLQMLPGIAGVLLLSAQRFTLEISAIALAGKIFAAIALCILWCLLCARTKKLQTNVSAIHADEFKILNYVAQYLPLVLLAVAFVSIIFGK